MEGLNVTFGIELEFVVAYQTGQYFNVRPLDPNSAVRAHIIQLLQEAGFSMNGLTPPFNYEFWTVSTDGSIDPAPVGPLVQWEDFQFSAIELISPKFFWSRSALAFQDLERVLQIIQKEFAPFTNRTCGMHIHVGNEEWAFPRSTLKKFAQVVTAFERQLAAIHPVHRVNNVHCRPPSSNFEGGNLVRNILWLQAAENTKTLINRMSCCPYGADRGFAYNLRNLITNEAPPTIEFRQHEATLDVVTCAAWASLACGLVARCHELTPAGLRNLLITGVSPHPPTLSELLDALDLGELASYYRQGTLHKHPADPLTYEGEAWVTETDTDVEMIDTSRRPENVSRAAPLSLSMTVQDQITSDAELCRRLCLNLRPRSKRSDAAAKQGSMIAGTAQNMDWETEYALHDSLRGVELDQDDENDEEY